MTLPDCARNPSRKNTMKLLSTFSVQALEGRVTDLLVFTQGLPFTHASTSLSVLSRSPFLPSNQSFACTASYKSELQ